MSTYKMWDSIKGFPFHEYSSWSLTTLILKNTLKTESHIAGYSNVNTTKLISFFRTQQTHGQFLCHFLVLFGLINLYPFFWGFYFHRTNPSCKIK